MLLADRVAVMRAGRVEQVADPAALRAAPATEYVAPAPAPLEGRMRAWITKSGARECGWTGSGRAPYAVCPGLSPLIAPPAAAQRPVVVASKPFGESYVLAEMFAQVLEARGLEVERRPGLGATEIAFGALRSGADRRVPRVHGDGAGGDPRRVGGRGSAGGVPAGGGGFAARFDAHWLPPLGFENTYAVAVRRETAERYGLRSLSDLARAAPELVAGFSPDFIGREDGLPGLRGRYGGLDFREVRSPRSNTKIYEDAT